jgi:hypothetical protein
MGMAPTVEIRPTADGKGCLLTYGQQQLWYELEVHAISFAQDACENCDIVVYHANGTVKHRYTAAGRAAPNSPPM